MTAAPTFSQIKAQVAAIRQKVPQARVIGIRAEGRWTGERRQQDGHETFRIEQCDSPLHMRTVLQDDDGVAITVLITSLDERELGDDILVRLARRRLFPIDSWQIVKLLFQARAIDPRVTQHGWMAEYLLEAIPADGFPPASGGFLDAETVWPILLDQHMGFVSNRPDLLALLQWSVNAEGVARFPSDSATMSRRPSARCSADTTPHKSDDARAAPPEGGVRAGGACVGFHCPTKGYDRNRHVPPSSRAHRRHRPVE